MADASPASSVSLLSRVFGRRPNEAETVSQDAPAEEVAAEESPVSEDFAVEDEARAGAPEPFLASPLRRSAAPDDAFETGEAGETGLTLGGLLAALWRRKLGIVSFTGICAVIALGVLLSVRPQYEASTRLLVEPASSIVPDALLNGTTQSRERIILDAEAIASQVELLRSRAVADRVIEALDLANRLEFASPSALESLFAILGAAPDQASLREQAVETYSDNLSVFHIPETRVLGIAFRSYDAELAAQVANAVAESYLALQVLGKSDATQAANDWLGGEIDRLRERVAVAERRVQSFRADAGLIRGANDTTLPAQRLSEINSQIARARALRIDAEGDADQIRRALRTNAEDGLVGAVDAPVMQRLLERLADVRTQLADASTTLGPSHPRIKQLNAQLSDVGAQVRLEARRMAAALDEEARTAQAREETLRAELAALQGEAADAEFQDVELRALEREAKAQRDLLETLLGRYRETSARQNPAAQPADARVISPAIAPLEPAFPKTGPTLMAVIVAALMTACGVVVAGALLSAARPVRRKVGPDEADHETAFAPAPAAPDWSATVPVPPAPMMAAEFGEPEPPLSYEPADVEEAPETAEAPLEPVQPDQVDPAFAETPEPALRPEEPARPPLRPMRADSLAEIAYRVGGYADALPRVVVVAPGVPVAALTGLVLADHLARLGKTTVCVDAGTHAPGRRLVDLLGQAKGEGSDDTGLSDLAMGAEFDEALRLIPGSRAHAITGGTHRPSLAVARETLDLLTETYDAIVVLAEARDLFDGQGLGLTSALVITDDCDAELIEATLSDLVSAGIEDVTMVTSDAAVVSLDEAA